MEKIRYASRKAGGEECGTDEKRKGKTQKALCRKAACHGMPFSAERLISELLLHCPVDKVDKHSARIVFTRSARFFQIREVTDAEMA